MRKPRVSSYKEVLEIPTYTDLLMKMLYKISVLKIVQFRTIISTKPY